MRYEIYTDGACSKNPGTGGYAFVILANRREYLKMRGRKEYTTNNEMELTAIVKAIKHIVYQPMGMRSRAAELELIVYSDSAYCINVINQRWINSWALNGWKNKDGKEIKNKELWQDMWKLLKLKNVEYEFVKVKGHSGDKYNEMVDKAAKLSYKGE